jgi:hypothetical protein
MQKKNKDGSDRTLVHLVEFAKKILLGEEEEEGRKKPPLSPDKKAVLIFAVRFALRPMESLASEFVEHRLGTLINVKLPKPDNPRDKPKLQVVYQSEPVLAEIAIRASTQFHDQFPAEFPLIVALRAFQSTLITSESALFIRGNKGDVGEFAAAMGLAFVRDKIRKPITGESRNNTYPSYSFPFDPAEHHDYMSRPIPVDVFLRNICYGALPDGTAFDFKYYPEYEVNFTHFVNRELKDCNTGFTYDRHAALFHGNNHVGIDLDIVMKHATQTKYRAISFQIKNYFQYLSQGFWIVVYPKVAIQRFCSTE